MSLIQNDPWFQPQLTDLKKFDIKEIANGLKFTKFNAGDYVFKNGQYGDKFFIIMKGVASIQIPFGLDVKQIIGRWLKFRDVSMNQLKDKNIREAQITSENNNKNRHLERYNELNQWYKYGF